jgi:hypothetical protein
MKSIIIISISLLFVCIGILIQTKRIKTCNPNAELLAECLRVLGLDQLEPISATGNINNGKN